MLDFIYATQPKEWQKMTTQHGADTKPMLLKRLASGVRKHVTLHVLRKGIKANGCRFRLTYFKPSSGLNESAQKLYLGNWFTIIRQLKYCGFQLQVFQADHRQRRLRRRFPVVDV